jgi:hypothetical protein
MDFSPGLGGLNFAFRRGGPGAIVGCGEQPVTTHETVVHHLPPRRMESTMVHRVHLSYPWFGLHMNFLFANRISLLYSIVPFIEKKKFNRAVWYPVLALILRYNSI